jgi:hypothetical protein
MRLNNEPKLLKEKQKPLRRKRERMQQKLKAIKRGKVYCQV